TNSVFGTVFNTDGITPVPNPAVSLLNVDSVGPEGFFLRNTFGDSSGNFQFSSAQVGTIQLSASDNSNRNLGGLVIAQLPAGQPLNVNIILGNAYTLRFPFFQRLNLDGGDGFRYDVDCDGSLSDGGTVDRHLNDAYDGQYFLNLGINQSS